MTDAKPYTVEEASSLAKSAELRWRGSQGAVPIDRLRQLYERHLDCQRLLATAQAAEQRWVPVTERLPETVTDCWVCRPDRAPHRALWTGLAFVDQHASEWQGITHWQPYYTPPAPEVE